MVLANPKYITCHILTLYTRYTVVCGLVMQAVFRVRPVSRCTASMSGHSEAVLSVSATQT